MADEQMRASTIAKRVEGNCVVAELGVFVGRMSDVLLSSIPTLTLVMVDRWPSKEETSPEYKATGDFHSSKTQDEQDYYYREASNVANKHGNRAKLYKMWTHEASKMFGTNTFDVVFIDADHSYEGTKRDIEDWWPLVKTGGWIGGHDYKNKGKYQFEVEKAVDEWVEKHQLPLELDANFTWWVRKL